MGVKIAAHSGCGSVVLVDEATEAIAAVEMVVLHQLLRLGVEADEVRVRGGGVPGCGAGWRCVGRVRWRRPAIRSQSRHSVLTVRTKCSAKACGACTGVWISRIPS